MNVSHKHNWHYYTWQEAGDTCDREKYQCRICKICGSRQMLCENNRWCKILEDNN